MRLVVAILACSTFAYPLSARCQQASRGSHVTLNVKGLTGESREITTADLASLRRVDTTVSAHMVTGRYGGVLLTDILSLVRAPHGDSLRGKAMTTYVVVTGADNYRVVFALAELDAGFNNRIAILADQKDGAPLPAAEGPYHLIVPGELRPARWVRQVVRIELRQAPEAP